MLTEVIAVDPERPDPAAISRAAACLRGGGLVAFPTETVYGLGVHALDRDAVVSLFEAKGRPANDPLIVHVSTLAEAAALVVGFPSPAALLAERFWPGPLTMIMRRAPRVPTQVSAGLATVAIRVPAHPVARALLGAAGIPVAAPSANLFSRPSPTCAQHVLQDLDGRIDMVLDGGPTDVGVESTVLDLTVEPPVILRPGAISLERLRTVVPAVTTLVADGGSDDRGAMASPGLLSKHYAPRAPLTIYRGDAPRVLDELRLAAHRALAAGHRVGILATAEDAVSLRGLPVVLADLGREDEVEHVAGRLYAALRELDDAGVDCVLTRDMARNDGLWRAIGDRLRRAAAAMVDVGDG
jgi:L-threonylcarbamoyladenylate synthase